MRAKLLILLAPVAGSYQNSLWAVLTPAGLRSRAACANSSAVGRTGVPVSPARRRQTKKPRPFGRGFICLVPVAGTLLRTYVIVLHGFLFLLLSKGTQRGTHCYLLGLLKAPPHHLLATRQTPLLPSPTGTDATHNSRMKPMLILTLKADTPLHIGENITVTLLEGSQVKIGVDAPKEVPVHRDDAKTKTPKT